MAHNKILIIEDDPANMELVTDLLEVAGYEIIQSRNAEKGIELAKSISPDLILMDIDLPGMNGIEATKILKSDPTTKNISIIAFTASVTQNDLELYSKVDFVTIIRKPINTREFAGQVAPFITDSNK